MLSQFLRRVSHLLTGLVLAHAILFEGSAWALEAPLPEGPDVPVDAPVLTLRVVPGTTEKVHQLTGELDLQHAEPVAGRSSSSAGLKGTDLGFSFEHDGQLWFLFGDTFEGEAIRRTGGVPSLIRGTAGAVGNLELLTPRKNTGLVHYWREDDAGHQPWHGPEVFGAGLGQVDAVSVVESSYDSLEVVIRTGDRLYFAWSDKDGWNGPFPLIADGTVVRGVTGNPVLLQSTRGITGNFEVVVPLVDGGIAHYWRDNDDPDLPWHGPVVFGGSRSYDAVTMIQSDFGSAGNLEVVARSHRGLFLLWDDARHWHGPRRIRVDGEAVLGTRGAPSLIQRTGTLGDFELVVPRVGGGLAHYTRNNDAPGLLWSGPRVFGEDGGLFEAAALVEGPRSPLDYSEVDLEVIARKDEYPVSFTFDRSDWLGTLFTLDLEVETGTANRYPGSDAIASSTATDPEDLVLTFETADDGHYRSPEVYDPATGNWLDLTGFEVPQSGFSANGQAYVFFTDDYDSDAGTMGSSFLAVGDDPASPLTKLYDFSRATDAGSGGFKFINVAPVVVSDGEVPGLPEGQGDLVLAWGSGEYRESVTYLAYAPVALVGDLSAWRYFAGRDALGLPTWSHREADVVALTDTACVGELSVSWNPYLERWLMLYNCDIPGAVRGVQAHVAKLPWGDWSPSATVFHPRYDEGYGDFIHNPRRGRSLYDNTFCMDPGFRETCHEPRNLVYGGEYGPYVINRFTTGGPGWSEVYFVLSIWNPYQTVLMKTRLELNPENGVGGNWQ
jgi:hypothetical protein